MTLEQQTEINLHLQAIANILYQQCDLSQLDHLAVIEETVRQQTLEYILLLSNPENTCNL
jgi:hypothetical protein